MMKPKNKKHGQESPKTRGFGFVSLSWQPALIFSPLTHLAQGPLWTPSVFHQDFSRVPSQDWGNLIGSAHLPFSLSLFLSLSFSPSSLSLFAAYVFNIFNEWVIFLNIYFIFFMSRVKRSDLGALSVESKCHETSSLCPYPGSGSPQKVTGALVCISQKRTAFTLVANSLKISAIRSRNLLLTYDVHLQWICRDSAVPSLGTQTNRGSSELQQGIRGGGIHTGSSMGQPRSEGQHFYLQTFVQNWSYNCGGARKCGRAQIFGKKQMSLPRHHFGRGREAKWVRSLFRHRRSSTHPLQLLELWKLKWTPASQEE